MAYQDKNDIDFHAYLKLIKKRKKFIGVVVCVTMIFSILFCWLSPKYYQSKTLILVLDGNSSGLASVLSGLGGLPALAGLGVNAKTSDSKLMTLLKSRTLSENIIREYNLLPKLYDSNEMNLQNIKIENAAAKLLSHMSFALDKKSSTIAIMAEFKDPVVAANIANLYVEGLQTFINRSSFTVAKKNRQFIEAQLEGNKKGLLVAGKQLNEFYKIGNSLNVDSKIDVPINTNLANYQKANDVFNADNEILNNNHSSLASQNSDKSFITESVYLNENDIKSDLNKTIKDVPQQVYFQYLTLRRNLLVQVNTLLTQQYELSKIEESKNEFAFQVIDSAKIPQSISRPKRRQIIVVAAVSSLFIAMFMAFILEYIGKIKIKENI